MRRTEGGIYKGETLGSLRTFLFGWLDLFFLFDILENFFWSLKIRVVNGRRNNVV